MFEFLGCRVESEVQNRHTAKGRILIKISGNSRISGSATPRGLGQLVLSRAKLHFFKLRKYRKFPSKKVVRGFRKIFLKMNVKTEAQVRREKPRKNQSFLQFT